MAGSIELRIVTPEKGVVSTQVEHVRLPGAEGYLGVLPGHAPTLLSLDIGAISYESSGKTHVLAVSGGFVEILRHRVTILAEQCEPAEDIDLSRAEAAKARAEEILRDASHREFKEAATHLRRAVTRIQVGSKK